MATLGKNIIIKWNNGGSLVAIAAAKSCSINHTCDMKEISSPSSPTTRTYMAGRKGWRVTIGTLLSDVLDLLKVGNSYTLNILNDGGSTGLSGTGLLMESDVTATVGNLATGSFVFQGSGDLVNMTSN